MRAKLFLFILAIVFVAVSANKAYVGLTNRRPTRMTCAEFTGGASSAKWVILTDCEIDLENAVRLESRVLGIDKGLYVPVRPVGSSGPAPVLLKIDGVDDTRGITDQRDPATPEAMDPPGEGSGKVWATVTGLVQTTFDSDSKSRRALDKVARDGAIRPDYVVIDAGKELDPSDAFFGVFFLLVTVLVIGLVIRSKRIQAARRAAGLTPPPIPPSPPSPV